MDRLKAGRFLVLAVSACLFGGPVHADPKNDRAVLQKELSRLTALPAGARVAPSIPSSKSLHPGDQAPAVAAVRAALAGLGFVDREPPADPSLYDDPFAEQVRRFQIASGLVPDGIVGFETRKLLSVGLTERTAMLQQTLGQPDIPDSGRFIEVNIADGMLRAYDDGRSVLTSRVVVGAKDTQTPVFTADASAILLNPAWIVPDSIVQKEFGGNPHTEQPGPANPLGPLLLSLPNRYEIFLHSTNEPGLFDRDVRAFSHGCVRVQEIEALTRWVMGEQRWNQEQVDAGLTQLTKRRFALDAPIPVVLTYRTATVGPTGAILYHPDPYRFAQPPEDAVASAPPSMAPPAAPTSAGPAGSGSPPGLPVPQTVALPR